jgi:hypothetical protein
LAFVVRWERGEIGGLPHCHILISRFPERSINPSYLRRDRSELPFSRLKACIAKGDYLADAKSPGFLEVRQAYLLSVRMFWEVARKLSVCGGKWEIFNQSAPTPVDFI